jgi:ubiquinone/menaquinone biosynthesis C-methylase UbiE
MYPVFKTVKVLYDFLKRFEEHRVNVVYKLLPLNGVFLDVGCGAGKLAHLAVDRFTEVYAIDICKFSLLKVKNRQKWNNCFFTQCDASKNLPYADNSFDVVACVAVLQYIPNRTKLILEFNRVLKSDGVLVIQVPNSEWLPSRLGINGNNDNIALTLKLKSNNTKHRQPMSNFKLSTFLCMLELSGFVICDKSTSGVFAGVRKSWISLLGGDLIIKCMKSTSLPLYGERCI